MKRKLKSYIIIFLYTLSFLMISTVVLTPTVSAVGENWWNVNWLYRKLITINASKIGEPLANFPVLIYTSADANLSAGAQPDGDDIAFINYYNNATQFPHEIESYISATGQLWAWVNVSSLSNISNTLVWMYYDNPAATNQQNIYGTWNQNYVMVQHMYDNTTSQINDSTSNKNNGTKKGAGEPVQATGKIAYGQDFDGTNDYVNILAAASLTFNGVMSVEVWVKSDDVTNDRTIIHGSLTALYTKSYWIETYVQKLLCSINGVYDYASFPVSQVISQWHNIVMAYDKTVGTIKGYVNGTLWTTKAHALDVADENGCRLGVTGSGSFYYNGIIDEVRISNICLNTSWIGASFNTSSSPTTFHYFGAEEGQAPPSTGGTTIKYRYLPVSTSSSKDRPISIAVYLPFLLLFLIPIIRWRNKK